MAALETSARADHHRSVRNQHQHERAHDYVEAIATLCAEKQLARVVDLQGVFGVSHVTVIRTLGRLEKQGWLQRMEGGAIELTEAGRHLAAQAAYRHQIVLAFLRQLGVSDTQAEADAEGIEHHVSQETLRAMEGWLRSRPATGV